VFEKLTEIGLSVNIPKCKFFVPELKYLGYRLSKDGLSATSEKVEAIKGAPAPQNVQQLRSYLGLLNFYHRFLPNLSTLLEPLHRLLDQKRKWEWGQAQADAFRKSKELLVSAPILEHFDPCLPIVVSADASPYGVGAVLAHRFPDGQEKPVCFASRTLSETERRYSQLH